MLQTADQLQEITILRWFKFIRIYIIIVLIKRTLKHPNIISLLGYAQNQERIVLIMNYVQGSNLHQLIFGKESQLSKVSQ